MSAKFDQYAEKYDSWFLDNKNVLMSEAALVAEALKLGNPPVLSVGCGSGLFEKILATEYGIEVADGVEPSIDMAQIARKRGMDVTVTTGEEFDFPKDKYSTVMFNGSPSYINDLQLVVKKVFNALPAGGCIILIDVPKESSYGLLYNLAKSVGSWSDELLKGTFPPNPYPIELVRAANWRTTSEKVGILEKCGFTNLKYLQTLTRHPLYSDEGFDQPVEGYDKGDYVAIIGFKPV